jgi:hypothetical protein
VSRFDAIRWIARRRAPAARDTGMVTAEVAVALPALVALLALALGALAVGVAQLRCVDAAREGARAAARGESGDQVQAAIRAAAPPGAGISVTVGPRLVRVAVSTAVKPVGPFAAAVGAVHITATAAAVPETAATAGSTGSRPP